jgi:hypothetical protein
MLRFLFALLLSCALRAAGPRYVFDNGTGRGESSVGAQLELANRTGYAGIFYSGTEGIPQGDREENPWNPMQAWRSF